MLRGGDLGEECGAEEALTWVEDLHSGVGVWMLFMDHLSADLLRKNLPGDPNRIKVINISQQQQQRNQPHSVYTKLCTCFIITSYMAK